MPITSVHSATTLSAYSRSSSVNYTNAAIDCLDTLTNDTITDNCDTLPSAIKDHLLEACIREYNRIGAAEAQNILLNSLIYYCATAMGVDECKFDGYFYFCDEEETEDSAFPIAIIAGVAGALLLLLLIILVVLIRKKMAKKKKEEEDLDQHYQMLHNANTNTRFNKSRLGRYDQKETSFSRRSSRVSDVGGSAAWSQDGRDSVCSESASIGSRFFESPIMFIGDAPSGTMDRSQTPSSARSFTPLSFFNRKQSVTPQSITVSPPARDVPEKFKSKQDFSNVKTEGKNTFSAVSKLIDKARKDNECTSPHPAPGAEPPARRVSSPATPMSPSSSGFFSYTSPRGAASTPTSPTSPGPSGGFFDKNGQNPLPRAQPNAPSSIFGGNSRGTPKPSFDAPTTLSGNRSTPQPKFGADPLSSPSPLGDAPTPWKKPAAIPRLPGPLSFGKRQKSSSAPKDLEKQNMIDDIDMM